MEILLGLKSCILCQGLQEIIAGAIPECHVMHRSVGSSPAHPDVVIFDDRRLAVELTGHYPEAKFLFLDRGLNDAELTCLLICHGVHGILSCTQDRELFIRAIRTILNGEIWLEQKQLKTVLRERNSLPHKNKTKVMSEQDRRIIMLITRGRKNVEIADELCLSEPTIKAHVSRIYRDLNVKNRAQLVTLATENGWSQDFFEV